MNLRRAIDITIAGAVGASVGALVILSVDAMTVGDRPGHTEPSVTTDEVLYPDDVPSRDRTTVLVWSPGGLPGGTESEVERITGVERVTTVRSGLVWLERSEAPDGSMIDRPPVGYRIPIEVAVVEPREYQHFVSATERESIRSLDRGSVVLSQGSARLRRTKIGSHLWTDSDELRVAGVISDTSANGYEMLLGDAPMEAFGNSYLLLHVRPRVADRIERKLKGILGPTHRIRVRTRAETPYLRYGDAVQPQLEMKRSFGEFAARLRGDGSFDIDPGWRAENIRTATVPILGQVTCHRAVIPQLKAALRAIRNQDLSSTIEPDDYGGCFSPRFINADPRRSISHHAWGIAVDINVSANDYGAEATMDERTVDVMRSWGFTWGGRWLIPDGMHFEWVRFPS